MSGALRRSSVVETRRHLRAAKYSEVRAQLVFGTEDHGPHGGEAPVERAGDLLVAHLFVVAQHQRNLVMVGQAIELLPDLALPFSREQLGERRQAAVGHL